MYERNVLLRNLRSTARATTDFAASALGYPVWNVVHREIDVLLEWTFRNEAVRGAILQMDGMEPDRVLLRRDASGGVERGAPLLQPGTFIECRAVEFDSRKIGTLELYYSDREVTDRVLRESLLIAAVVLVTDSVLGLFLFLVLRSTVFTPLERIERWAASLERGESPEPPAPASADKGEIASLRNSIERMVGIISAKEREARSLLECSPVSIWELDLSSVKKACGNVLASGGQFGPDEVAAAIPLVAVTSVNTITLEWLGIDELADVPRWFSSFQEEDTFVLFADELRALAGRAPGASGECRFTMPGGERRVFAVRFATIAGHEDDWARVLVTAADITDRTLAEERLVSALAEKNVLLKELFHRTRNSLQVVSSLITLRESGADDRHRAQMRAIRSRIDTMALAQDALFDSGDLTAMDLGRYVHDLATMLAHEYGDASGRVRLDVRTDSVSGSIDQAVPLGLFVCELVANSFIHGFPDGRGGTLSVVLKVRDAGVIELTVSDDGVGHPEGFDPVKDAGLGLATAAALGERQLNGTLSFSAERGFSTTLSFRLPDCAPRV